MWLKESRGADRDCRKFLWPQLTSCPDLQATWIDHSSKCAVSIKPIDSAFGLKIGHLILQLIAVSLVISQHLSSKADRSSLKFAVKTVLHCVKGDNTLWK